MEKDNVAKYIREFDEIHIIKQIILIGEDNMTRNIVLDNELEERGE